MGSQLPALEQLFDEWSKKHQEKLSTAAPYCMPEQEEPYGGFVRDGIVNLESWKKQKVRICFILNEAGGRNGMEHYPNDFDLAAEWNERGSFSKFMFKLSVWTKAIQDAFGQPITYKKSDVAKIRDELIRSIAVINIKKSDGQRRTDFEILQRFANEDADELRRELELVNPNIIICGENLRFLREPLPIPPNKKAKLEREAAAAAAANSDTTVAPAENAETTTTEETVAATENATPEENATAVPTEIAEGEKKNYVFKTNDLIHLSKFTYLWGNKLVFSMWTPANFMGTISSNTINYYAVREVVRAALKAFGDYQKRQKIKQFNEQRHQEKLQRKQEAQQKKAAQAAKADATSETQPATTEVKPAATPAPETVAAPEPAAAPKATKTAKKAATPAAETVATPEPAATPKATKTTKKAATTAAETADTPPAETKPKTRRTKKVVEDSAVTEETPKKTTRRTKKVTTEE